MSDLLAKSMRLAPACLYVLAVFGVAEVIHHAGFNPFEPSPAATTATSNSPEVVASEARGEQP